MAAKRKIKRIRFEEPSVDNWETLSEPDRVSAVQGFSEVYREMFGNTKLRVCYYKWVDANVEKQDRAAAKAGAPIVTHLLGSYARMEQQGYLTEYYHNALVTKTLDVIEHGRKILAEKGATEKPKGYKPTIQEAIAEQTGWIIGEVEGEVDDFLTAGCKKSKYSLYKFLEGKQVKGPHTKRIQNVLAAILKEVKDLVAGDDEQLNEGYSFLTKPQQKKYRAFVQQLVDDAEAWGNVRKAARKPRSKKVKTASQQAVGVKYMERDDENDLTSVAPSKLVNASQVWLYDTVNRFLYRYDSPGGMSLKGSTMKDWSEKTSVKKKIRKPEVVLPELMKGGKVKLRKLMDEIKAKPGKVTGRINKNMVIVKVVS